ncbi:glycosyltransferase family 2 protein [Gordonia sp. CPCC 205515]|uniref:glycosyltransferase n=1 Tax=Gordonia sp. CPCC 205515 TaxID=3140791 RepID=UPI003AF3CD93
MTDPAHNRRRGIERIFVVVPAHNEQCLLPACLASLSAAAAHVPVPVEVTVVLDTCTDATRRAVPRHVNTLEVSYRSVGAARRAGFAEPFGYLDAGALATTWLATTDADSTVPAHWFAQQLTSAAAGADGYAGTVTPRDWVGWPDHTALRFAQRYRGRDGHRHIHGANLAFRAQAYAAVGGFSTISAHEDVDLVRRLEADGARIAWCGRAPVVTSTRRRSRTDGGFATYLHSLTGPVAPS